ncbi:MAG: DEAD/DEAH box helicase family protein [Selenomonadaceae bacterium]|nr:DEAD/DEAH box helicase family protein [Selenomonadaceae bacterium]
MKFELLSFQQQAVEKLRLYLHIAQGIYRKISDPQVISFTAPTGAGKTIMLASLVENVYRGIGKYSAQPDAIFIWLSDSPQLNEQSCNKFYFYADGINQSQLVMIDTENFNQEVLDDGKIYFLNTQKLGKSSNLTTYSDTRNFTIWETLQNTIKTKTDKIYFIIDEAHRGMKGIAAGRATTIMQKFIKGSAEDGLSPAPLVIGMSATIERFNKLVAANSMSSHRVIVTDEEVKESGLLKERIIVTYPDEKSDKIISKDMAILEAAADDWKNKCEHWQQYLSANHEKIFNPIFVIQVENSIDKKFSATDLDDCLKKIVERTGINFEVGEVVHTFGNTHDDLTINNLRVIYAEPSSISGNDKIRVVFFKENLSTGWDCPQAETMMSFRRAVDATYIAQLLGRMIRTPLQRRIDSDETLNEVKLFLPHFDPQTVQEIINAYKKSEEEEIPTEIIGESLNERKIATLTVKNVNKISAPKNISDNGLFNFENKNPSAKESDDTSTEKILPENKFTPPLESAFNREEIVRAINEMALTTYKIKSHRINDYLKSLFKMAHFLMRSGLYYEAKTETLDEIAVLIHQYIEGLKKFGEYESLHSEIKNFKLAEQIFDSSGKPILKLINQNLFVSTNSDIERQFQQAEVKLKNEGVAQHYLNKFANTEDMDDLKIDVIIFAKNAECLEKLEQFAAKKFHALNDTFRRQTANIRADLKNEYNKIVSDADFVSKHNFYLPETIAITHDADGKIYSDHLFVDKISGTAKIKLNGWEEAVLAEERRRKDFVCWLRNVQNKNWALCIKYKNEGNETRAFYPDFLIIRRDDTGYIVDILETHNPNERDNIGKARGLAEYVKENLRIGRVQLIREKNSAGQKFFKRLDVSKSEIREQVLKAATNNGLDNIFEMN